jgi:hypothetical protein
VVAEAGATQVSSVAETCVTNVDTTAPNLQDIPRVMNWVPVTVTTVPPEIDPELG